MSDKPTARIPFKTWQEFARFLTQKGSSDGLFIRARKPPAIGTELGLQFKFPDESELDLSARVVAVQHAPAATPGMTVQFTSMSAEEAQAIQQAIRRASAAPREQKRGGDAHAAAPAQPQAASAARAPQPAAAPPPRPAAAGRFAEVERLADTSKYDRAEELVRQMLADHAGDRDARVWQLIIQARRHRAQFSFDDAIACYQAVLMLDDQHLEARRELQTLGGEAERSKDLMERVFGNS